MPDKVRIALDAMGGDFGPSVVVPGAQISLDRHPGIEFLLFGDRALIEPLLDARPQLKAASRVFHTDVAIAMNAKPSQALRQGRWKSSMSMAIDAVKRGEADLAVSAGNTGAMMALAKFQLKTMAGIDRPAIAARWPTIRGESIVLDLGASIGADAPHLVDLAVMGSAMARVLFGRERPDGRPPQYRGRRGEGPRGSTRGRADPARAQPAVPRILRLRRRRRHRPGRRGRGRHGRLRRQHRAQGRRRHGAPDRAFAQGGDEAARSGRSSAMCSRAARFVRWPPAWTRARPTAACSLG